MIDPNAYATAKDEVERLSKDYDILLKAARKVVRVFSEKDLPGWRPSDLRAAIAELQSLTH